MNDLQSKLAAFYRDCEQRLAVCEAEGQSLFQAWCGNAYEWDALTDLEQQRWNRFSASRNQRPGEIRALVKLVKALEKAAKEINDNMSECCSAGFHDPGWPDCDICTKCKEHSSPCFTEAAELAQAALREILADWRSGQ